MVIVTALDSEDEKLKAIEVGADDFVTKPYNSIILLTRVRSLLRLKRLNDEPLFRGRPSAQLSLVAAEGSATQAMPYTDFALRSTSVPSKAK